MSDASRRHSDAELRKIHAHSSRHRDEILASDVCGCFHCGRTFSPMEIESWIDDEATAMCPNCGIDAVIGSASGFAPTARLLKQMRAYWF